MVVMVYTIRLKQEAGPRSWLPRKCSTEIDGDILPRLGAALDAAATAVVALADAIISLTGSTDLRLRLPAAGGAGTGMFGSGSS